MPLGEQGAHTYINVRQSNISKLSSHTAINIFHCKCISKIPCIQITLKRLKDIRFNMPTNKNIRKLLCVCRKLEWMKNQFILNSVSPSLASFYLGNCLVCTLVSFFLSGFPCVFFRLDAPGNVVDLVCRDSFALQYLKTIFRYQHICKKI